MGLTRLCYWIGCTLIATGIALLSIPVALIVLGLTVLGYAALFLIDF
jgi:hypothetical protein